MDPIIRTAPYVWKVEPYRMQDPVLFYKLDQVCFPSDIAYSLDELKFLLESPRCFTWVAEDSEGTLGGFIIVERRRKREGLIGHIITIDVGPSARRQGIGRLLLSASEQQLRREGALLLTLEVAEDNESAQAFYRQSGYLEVGRIPNYYAGRLAARVLQKKM